MRPAPLYEAALRALDVAGALAVIAGLAVLMPFLALAIKLESPGPVFFGCDRLGRYGKPFRMLKFRTMAHNAPEKFNADGSRLVEQGDARVTRVGATLRTGLDELPQAFSILRGDLSFIGPRPDDVFATAMYEGTDWLKLSVKPGLTGLSQVSGRNDLPYRERLRHDAYYALRRNLWLDARIVLRTLGVLLGVKSAHRLVSEEQIAAALSEFQASRDSSTTLRDRFFRPDL
tara:strand:- start:6825 stop:7517 length:693 start_codon:yes stop_codon:yes gene_type:complete